MSSQPPRRSSRHTANSVVPTNKSLPNKISAVDSAPAATKKALGTADQGTRDWSDCAAVASPPKHVRCNIGGKRARGAAASGVADLQGGQGAPPPLSIITQRQELRVVRRTFRRVKTCPSPPLSQSSPNSGNYEWCSGPSGGSRRSPSLSMIAKRREL